MSFGKIKKYLYLALGIILLLWLATQKGAAATTQAAMDGLGATLVAIGGGNKNVTAWLCWGIPLVALFVALPGPIGWIAMAIWTIAFSVTIWPHILHATTGVQTTTTPNGGGSLPV